MDFRSFGVARNDCPDVRSSVTVTINCKPFEDGSETAKNTKVFSKVFRHTYYHARARVHRRRLAVIVKSIIIQYNAIH